MLNLKPFGQRRINAKTKKNVKQLIPIFIILLFNNFVGNAQIKTETNKKTKLESRIDSLSNFNYSEIDFNEMKAYFKSDAKFKEVLSSKASKGDKEAEDLLNILENSYADAIKLNGKHNVDLLINRHKKSKEILEKFEALEDKFKAQLKESLIKTDSLETHKTHFKNHTNNLKSDLNIANFKVVKNFIEAYNAKDSVATFKLLHKDFVELYDKKVAIKSKTDYANNYAWGNVMNDKMEYLLVLADEMDIEIISTYHCDRDRLLGVSPYKSIRTFTILDGQILNIKESKLSGFEDCNTKRSEKYQLFFNWLSDTYNLTPLDFKFNKSGAEKLKKAILEYSNQN